MASQLELIQKPFIELQIEALIQENKAEVADVTEFVETLQKAIFDIKDIDYERVLNREFRVPLIGRPNAFDADYPKHFKFAPPEDVQIIGSFKTSTALNKTSRIDLAVCMPASCFDKKDIKNQRYHTKRALYLAQLALLLNRSVGKELSFKIEFQYHRGDFLKPVLLVQSKDADSESFKCCQIFAFPHQDIPFKIEHLKPTHGNISPKWFFENYTIANAESLGDFLQSDSDVCPSPYYNSSILVDMEMLANSNLLHEQIGHHRCLTEALTLLKIWIYQRGLHHHFSFVLSMYVACLQTKQIIHQNMSSFQVFKMVIKHLATTTWDSTGHSYFDDLKEKISDFKEASHVIFLSPSGNLNICYDVTQDLYKRLRHEAQLAFNILSTNSTDMFELLFLQKIDFVKKFDVIIRMPNCTTKLPVKLDYLKKFMDHGVITPRVYSQDIIKLLERGLNDRVTLIQQNSAGLIPETKWNFKSIPFDPQIEENLFTIGLLIDQEISLRTVDIGPPADSNDAQAFKDFWDPKCQLRLQNGIISETVVWHVSQFSQRRAILKYIITHVLRKVDIKHFSLHYTTLEHFIGLKNVYFRWANDIVEEESKSKKRKHCNSDGKEILPVGTGEEIFQKAMHAYNELNKILRSVQNVNHTINSIQPISPKLRGCSIFPPLPVSLQQRNESLKRRKGVTLFPENFDEAGKILHIEPIDILLTLESSGKWPSDQDAFQAAKMDYLIKLGEELKEKEYSVKFSNEFLDVMHGQFVFRLHMKCPKDSNRSTNEVAPRIHAALDQLYRERPAFGLTCRLVKRWVACQLMTDHVDEIALELLVAHLFIHPEPYAEPASSSCGFRRFLMLVSTHDWKTSPVIVNFNDQLKMDEIKRVRDAIADNRGKYPPMVIFTPFDKEFAVCTKSEPSQPNLDLLCQLCGKALDFLNTIVINGGNDVVDSCKALFRPNFKVFNMLIKLNANVIQNFFMSIDAPRDYKLIGKDHQGSQTSALKVMPIVGLNLVEQFVKNLRNKYEKVASFFYDKYGQKVIGVILKPQSEEILEGNLKNFIDEVKTLGSKMVKTVETVNLN